jgi:hypothetical protein
MLNRYHLVPDDQLELSTMAEEPGLAGKFFPCAMPSTLSFIAVIQRALSPYIGSLDPLSAPATITNFAAKGMAPWILNQQSTI